MHGAENQRKEVRSLLKRNQEERKYGDNEGIDIRQRRKTVLQLGGSGWQAGRGHSGKGPGKGGSCCHRHRTGLEGQGGLLGQVKP